MAPPQKHKGDYQRLEFLGDRVLGLIIAEHLFRAYPGHGEGELTAMPFGPGARAVLCRGGRHDRALRPRHHRHRRARQGHEPEPHAAGRRDGGADRRDLSRRRLGGGAALRAQGLGGAPRPPVGGRKDAKTFLQEWALARALPIPAYTTVSREGPEHEPVFVVSVEVKGKEPALGTAESKRAAEMDAAEKFLKREGIRP